MDFSVLLGCWNADRIPSLPLKRWISIDTRCALVLFRPFPLLIEPKLTAWAHGWREPLKQCCVGLTVAKCYSGSLCVSLCVTCTNHKFLSRPACSLGQPLHQTLCEHARHEVTTLLTFSRCVNWPGNFLPCPHLTSISEALLQWKNTWFNILLCSPPVRSESRLTYSCLHPVLTSSVPCVNVRVPLSTYSMCVCHQNNLRRCKLIFYFLVRLSQGREFYRQQHAFQHVHNEWAKQEKCPVNIFALHMFGILFTRGSA